MEIINKLTKQIEEAKYLTQENAWRYRTILRYFYLQYERIKYWLYKEGVLEELKKHELFENYTMEQCKQDLDILVEWGNLIPVQDTSKVATVEEFKNKQFRYKLSEYTVEIERMTIKLENLFVEGASLEPSLLERLKTELKKFKLMLNKNEKEAGIWWNNLNADFKRLNQNYQDYIRDLHSVKAEEMMKTKEFLVFKDKFIKYLRDFIKALQQNVYEIEVIINEITKDEENIVLKKVFQYEKSIPRLDMDVITHEQINDNIVGRWNNLKEWFLGKQAIQSEAAKLFDITNEIIRKITRYAVQISESRNSAANRKEEYKKTCKLFIDCENIDEAHKLSAYVFGISHMRHIKANIIRETESINSGVFEEIPYEVKIKPRVRTYREKAQRNSIKEHMEEKQILLKKILQTRQEEKQVMDKYIVDNEIDFEQLPIIESHVRNTLLRWLGKALSNTKYESKTDDGRNYRIINPKEDKRCILKCEDGIFKMPAYKIKFMD